jgi:hypothetical protein
MKLDPNLFSVHDISRFPFCVVRNHAVVPGYSHQWDKEITALMNQPQPFVLVYLSTVIEESHEDRRHRGIWLKQNKEPIARVCKSLISVEPDAVRREEIRLQGQIAVKAFGIPHAAVASLDEAQEVARELLG